MTLLLEIAKDAYDLAGFHPTPIERSLTETASLARFALRLVEIYFASTISAAKGITPKQSESYHRRLNPANGRYLSTLRILGTVRRLAVPTVQVNEARKQVNIAGSTPLKFLNAKHED